MKTLLNKAYLTCWLTIPILILIGLLFNRHTIDIQLYDTYFIISNPHFILAASLLLLLIGLGYWLINRRGKFPDRVLIAVHLLLTVGVLLLFAVPMSQVNGVLSTWLTWGIVALLLAQFIYLINILTTLLRK